MREEYYTPELSDLFIGYECEVLVGYSPSMGETFGKTQEWHTYVIDEVSVRKSDYSSVSYTSDLFSREIIRTPFLSKEQIEAEGWAHEEGSRFIKPSGNTLWYKKGRKTIKQELHLELFYHRVWSDNRLIITELESPRRVLYSGYCPTINEFRKILKLLNI